MAVTKQQLQQSLPSPLSMSQEKARNFLDRELRKLDGDWKKRSVPSSPAATLTQYLDRVQRLLEFTLQMPPTGSWAWMRTDFLLRIMGDALKSVPKYPCPPLSMSSDVNGENGALTKLLAFLDTLDRGWLAVLRGQTWDVERGEGVDTMDVDGGTGTGAAGKMSQTERTRLRSMLFSDTTPLEAWLMGESENGSSEGDDSGARAIALERLGLNDLFSRTLGELEVLSGVVVSQGSEAKMS